MTVVILRIILVFSIARRRSGADGLVGHGDGELRTLISRQDALARYLAVSTQRAPTARAV